MMPHAIGNDAELAREDTRRGLMVLIEDQGIKGCRNSAAWYQELIAAAMELYRTRHDKHWSVTDSRPPQATFCTWPGTVLGSTRLVTKASTHPDPMMKVVERHDYRPYGEELFGRRADGRRAGVPESRHARAGEPEVHGEGAEFREPSSSAPSEAARRAVTELNRLKLNELQVSYLETHGTIQLGGPDWVPSSIP
jgi:hypothetical protein